MTTQIEIHPAQVRQFADQVGRAASSAVVLQAYAGGVCAETSGLDNVLGVFADLVLAVAEVNRTVLRRSNNALWDTVHDINRAVDWLEYEDAAAAQRIHAVFPQAPAFFPDLTGPGSLHGFDDLAQPAPAAPLTRTEAVTADDIDPGGTLGVLDEVCQRVFGESLLTAIIQPVFGDPGRLAWLSEAYTELGKGTYQIAWNLRSGTVNAAPHWNGATGQAFEVHMFRWHMGLGGLGDAQHLIAALFGEAYKVASAGIRVILRLINRLLVKAAEFASKKSIPVVGQLSLGWDLLTGEFFDDVEEFIDDIRAIKRRIEELKASCDRIRREIEEVQQTIDRVLYAAHHPGAALHDWAEQAQNDVLNAEGRDGYQPSLLTASRIAILPI